MLTANQVQDYDGVSLAIADLAPAVAELWTGHPVKLLSTTPLSNRIMFGFDVPKDTTFVIGDSMVFSFNAEFIPFLEQGAEREAYASIVLEYDNDTSYHAAGISVKEPGAYSLTVPRNFENRMKSMSGYIYYYDNDTALVTSLLLSNISLKRFHPVELADSVQ